MWCRVRLSTIYISMNNYKINLVIDNLPFEILSDVALVLFYSQYSIFLFSRFNSRTGILLLWFGPPKKVKNNNHPTNTMKLLQEILTTNKL